MNFWKKILNRYFNKKHLVGTSHDLIVSEVSTLRDDAVEYEKMSMAVNLYGAALLVVG